MSQSTSVENPVNQIAELLTAIPEKENQSPQVETPEAVSENDIDTPPVTESESGDSSESESESKPETVDTESSEDSVDTLNNLAEQLDVPVEDLYQLNVNMGQDNAPKTLGALKDFYEANRDIEQSRENIVQRNEELQREFDNTARVPQITNEILDAKAKVMSIRTQYENINWDMLRQRDAGQYAAMQTDFNKTYAQAEQTLERAEQQAENMFDDSARFQQERLFENMPELRDNKTRIEASRAVNDLAKQYGFSDNDIAQITDNRLIRLLIDASKVALARANVKDKTINDAPSTIESSAAGNIPISNRKATLKKLTEKAKRTNDNRDKSAAISALLQ